MHTQTKAISRNQACTDLHSAGARDCMQRWYTYVYSYATNFEGSKPCHSSSIQSLSYACMYLALCTL